MFSSIGFAGSSTKYVQHVTLLISSSIKCSAFKYSVFFYVSFPFGLHVFFFFYSLVQDDFDGHSPSLHSANRSHAQSGGNFNLFCIFQYFLFIYYDLFFLIIYKMEVIMISFHHMYTTKVFRRNRMCVCFFNSNFHFDISLTIVWYFN